MAFHGQRHQDCSTSNGTTEELPKAAVLEPKRLIAKNGAKQGNVIAGSLTLEGTIGMDLTCQFPTVSFFLRATQTQVALLWCTNQVWKSQ